MNYSDTLQRAVDHLLAAINELNSAEQTPLQEAYDIRSELIYSYCQLKQLEEFLVKHPDIDSGIHPFIGDVLK